MSDDDPDQNEIIVSSSLDSPPEWIGLSEPFSRLVLKKLLINNWELSIHICNDHEIRDLNNRYRGKDSPTDILSFSQESDFFPGEEESGLVVAGDIVISSETLERNSSQLGIPVETELKRLIIHGILHLKGMEHKGAHMEDYKDCEMITLQEKLLSELTEEMS